MAPENTPGPDAASEIPPVRATASEAERLRIDGNGFVTTTAQRQQLFRRPKIDFRKSSGQRPDRWAANETHVVLRNVPLSMGKRRGDFVECACHALTFDASGSSQR